MTCLLIFATGWASFESWIESNQVELSMMCYLHLRWPLGIVNWKKVTLKIRNRIQVVDNCNTVVRIGKELDLVLVNIGGIDIADKNKKLILAIMWQLMRRFTLDMLATLSGDGSKITEERMVQWANAKVKINRFAMST